MEMIALPQVWVSQRWCKRELCRVVYRNAVPTFCHSKTKAVGVY